MPKHLIANQSKYKSEETLSEQMLSGIPEVDLGVEERIRNIEDTEKAKQRLIVNINDGKSKRAAQDQYISSTNYVQHKRFDDTLFNPERSLAKQHQKATLKKELKELKQLDVPVVGDAEKHELLLKSLSAFVIQLKDGRRFYSLLYELKLKRKPHAMTPSGRMSSERATSLSSNGSRKT